MPDALETARLALAANLPQGDSKVGRYTVSLTAECDPNDPQRGAWVDCWVTSPGGGHTNSLACLEGEGRFDDGPTISEAAIDQITAFAQKHGY